MIYIKANNGSNEMLRGVRKLTDFQCHDDCRGRLIELHPTWIAK